MRPVTLPCGKKSVYFNHTVSILRIRNVVMDRRSVVKAVDDMDPYFYFVRQKSRLSSSPSALKQRPRWPCALRQGFWKLVIMRLIIVT